MTGDSSFDCWLHVSLVLMSTHAFCVNLGVCGHAYSFQLVRRLRPKVVCIVDEDLAGTVGSMPQRFRACMENYSAFLHANDACSEIHRRKRVCTFELSMSTINTCSIVACEGQERLVRPLSAPQWDIWLKHWGLQPIPVEPHVVDTLDSLLKRFPQGFNSQHNGHWMHLNWERVSLAAGSCSVPT